MPTLNRRRDGGYFIRGSVAGRLCTWQIHDEGLALLQLFKIDGVTNNFVPLRLVHELRKKGFIYTGGSGIQPGPTLEENLATNGRTEFLLLALAEESEGWSLSLVFPELPPNLLGGLGADELVQLLACCFFRINGNDTLPAIRLWPGKGGTVLSVPPQNNPYTVELVGDWPAAWDLNAWIIGAEGLQPEGTLFAGAEVEGVRLRPGEPVAPNTSYYLVVSASSGRRPATYLPRTVQRRWLGQFHGWEAWELHLPSVADSSLLEWCQSIGHPLEEPVWRIALVSPPPRQYHANGLPVIAAGEEALIQVAPPPGGTLVEAPTEVCIERDGSPVAHITLNGDGPQHFTVPVSVAGAYRLWAPEGRVAPLAFSVIALDPATGGWSLVSQPGALRVSIRYGDFSVDLDAFRDGPGPYELELTPPPPALTVNCPGPVDLSWSVGELRCRRLEVPAVEVADCLATDLSKGLSSNWRFILRIDAGTFGTLQLQLVPARAPAGVHKQAQAALLPAPLVRRARWLAAVLSSPLYDLPACTVPLPLDVRATLNRLRSYPQFTVLAHATAAPVELAPHVYALARALTGVLLGDSEQRTCDKAGQELSGGQNDSRWPLPMVETGGAG